jgi:hypothetical protein
MLWKYDAEHACVEGILQSALMPQATAVTIVLAFQALRLHTRQACKFFQALVIPFVELMFGAFEMILLPIPTSFEYLHHIF